MARRYTIARTLDGNELDIVDEEGTAESVPLQHESDDELIEEAEALIRERFHPGRGDVGFHWEVTGEGGWTTSDPSDFKRDA